MIDITSNIHTPDMPMENKTMKATYERECYLCKELSVYILRDTNVNPSITDKEIQTMIGHIKDEFIVCEKCEKITLQKLVAYNF